MKLAAISTTLLLILCACSTPKPPAPNSAAALQLEAAALSEHTKSIEAYRAWLKQANAVLLEQQKTLQGMIDDTRNAPQRNIEAQEQQYKLLLEMTDMNSSFVQLQTSAQVASQHYAIVANMLRLQSEARQEAIDNMK